MNKKKLIALICVPLALLAGFFIYQHWHEPDSTVAKEPVQKPLSTLQVSEEKKTEVKTEVQDKKKAAKPAALEQKTAETANSSNGSNQKLSWYYKPNSEHKLPEVDPKGKALLNRYKGLYHGNVNEKTIYLTFDEGYENGYTPKILDALKESNVKAAFFITGDYIRRHPDLVERMVNEGHIVGNHTDNHPSLPEVNDTTLRKEINVLSESFEKLTGQKMTYLRPPKGEYSERTLKITREMGYTNVFWSVALVDWRPDAGTPEQNKVKVMERLHNGAIVLLHAVNKANAEMLTDLIRECRQQGYQFKRLNEIN